MVLGENQRMLLLLLRGSEKNSRRGKQNSYRFIRFRPLTLVSPILGSLLMRPQLGNTMMGGNGKTIRSNLPFVMTKMGMTLLLTNFSSHLVTHHPHEQFFGATVFIYIPILQAIGH